MADFILFDMWVSKVEKIFKGTYLAFRQPGFNPFTFSENSNYIWKVCLRCNKTLLDVVKKTFENKKFDDITQQCFALLPQANFFQPIIWSFDFFSRHEKQIWK